MPIRGIDNQIMVTKTQELTGERAREMHQQGNAAVNMTRDQRRQTEINANRAQAVTKGEHKRVNVDEERETAQGKRKKRMKKSVLGFYYEDDSEEPAPAETGLPPAEKKRFDISI